jgi:hypothetical protein
VLEEEDDVLVICREGVEKEGESVPPVKRGRYSGSHGSDASYVDSAPSSDDELGSTSSGSSVSRSKRRRKEAKSKVDRSGRDVGRKASGKSTSSAKLQAKFPPRPPPKAVLAPSAKSKQRADERPARDVRVASEVDEDVRVLEEEKIGVDNGKSLVDCWPHWHRVRRQGTRWVMRCLGVKEPEHNCSCPVSEPGYKNVPKKEWQCKRHCGRLAVRMKGQDELHLISAHSYSHPSFAKAICEEREKKEELREKEDEKSEKKKEEQGQKTMDGYGFVVRERALAKKNRYRKHDRRQLDADCLALRWVLEEQHLVGSGKVVNASRQKLGCRQRQL